MQVVILIPTYNEAENIGKLLDELMVLTGKIKKHQFKIVVADDHSPDGTGEIVDKFRLKHNNIFLLSHAKEGLGKAMIRGYSFAIKKFRPDVIVANEADFGFDFKHLPSMLEKIAEGYDVVVASRHVGIGKTEGWTVNRRANHFIANTVFARWLAGIREVYDKNGAFRAIRVRGVLDKINFSKFNVRGFGFFFYLIYCLSKVTTKFYEFPVTYRFRSRGESKVSFNPKYFGIYLRDVAEYIRLAFQIRQERCNI